MMSRFFCLIMWNKVNRNNKNTVSLLCLFGSLTSTFRQWLQLWQITLLEAILIMNRLSKKHTRKKKALWSIVSNYITSTDLPDGWYWRDKKLFTHIFGAASKDALGGPKSVASCCTTCIKVLGFLSVYISPKNHFSVIGPMLSTFSAWCIVNALVVLLQENSTKRFDEFCLVSHKI